MLTRSAWFFVGTLAMVGAGCGGSPDDGDTQTASDPASASEQDDPQDTASKDADVADAPIVQTDAGALAGEDAEAKPSPAISEDTYRATCEETCAAQSKCVGLSGVKCLEECTAQAAAHAAHTCLGEGLDELRCLGALTCEELWDYGTKGRRDHPTCGAQAVAYFEACTVGGGDTPADCSAMCSRLAACGALQEAVPACEETCILRATGAVWNVSTACRDAFLAVAGCVAEAACADVAQLATLGTIPPSCVTLEAARDAACN